MRLGYPHVAWNNQVKLQISEPAGMTSAQIVHFERTLGVFADQAADTVHHVRRRSCVHQAAD